MSVYGSCPTVSQGDLSLLPASTAEARALLKSIVAFDRDFAENQDQFPNLYVAYIDGRRMGSSTSYDEAYESFNSKGNEIGFYADYVPAP